MKGYADENAGSARVSRWADIEPMDRELCTATGPLFPDRPSTRWPVGDNAVQVILQFFGLRAVALSDWGTTNVGDLRIETEDGVILFQFESPTARLSGVAEFFEVASISGYINGNPDLPSK